MSDYGTPTVSGGWEPKEPMSKLEKAIDRLKPHAIGGDGKPMYAEEIKLVLAAARRFASLTSPETKQRVRRVFTHDFALHLDLSDSTIDELTVAVLRSVEEGKT